MKTYYYSVEMDTPEGPLMTISTDPDDVEEVVLEDELDDYFVANNICEIMESMFGIPDDFDEQKFVDGAKEIGFNMVKATGF